MHGLYQSTSLRGRAVSWVSSTLLTLCLVGAPLHAFAQTDADHSFSTSAGEVVDKAFDLAADDDVPGAIEVLDELALQPDLNTFERSAVSQMIGAYHYELGQLYEAKIAFEAAFDAGGLTPKEIAGMKPILANINALDKLGLLKPKAVAPIVKAAPKVVKPVIVKTEPVPEVNEPALLMASSSSERMPFVEASATEPVLIKSSEDIAVTENVEAQVPVKEAALKDIDDDRDAQPLIRIPPVMPRRFLEGDNSGYCDVRFDVSPEGKPMNVDTIRCTESNLKRETIKSVEKWKFTPKIVNGRAVPRSGVESKVRYILTDERGRKLPLPSGF